MPALKGKALVAYLLVCVFWGSTYLAIRIGLKDLPPYLFAGLRFIVAGAVLFTIAWAIGHRLPTSGAVWRTQAIVGLFLLVGGNANVVWAQQYVPSGVASIFIVTVALWMALFDAIVPGGSGRVSWRIIAGLLLGFIGSAMLIGTSPRAILESDLRGPAALTLASASWAYGSVYFKRRPSDISPYVAASIQMLVGGVAVTLLGLMVGEGSRWVWTSRGLGAMAYLVVFGSLVGYSAYFYALRHASPTVVGTYAYVNPVIAVILGAIVLDETIGPRTVFAMALILGAVVWIQFSRLIPGLQSGAHSVAGPEPASISKG